MKDAYWFKHDSNARNDEQIIDLRGDLGYEGYGIYWALIEFLRDTENYEADYKPKRLAMAIQAEEGLIVQVITTYGLFVVDEEGKFYSKSLKVRMEAMDKKREQQRKNANKRWEKEQGKGVENSADAMALPSQSHKSIEEQKRIEKIKKEHRKGNERVEGEKGKTYNNFIEECLEIRNVYPIQLICEYLLFCTKVERQLEKQVEKSILRENFKTYLKTVDLIFNSTQTRHLMEILALKGFNATNEQIKLEIDLYAQNYKDNMTSDQVLAEFLVQLNEKKELMANPHFKELARPYFKIH